jgi:hypothetical protein
MVKVKALEKHTQTCNDSSLDFLPSSSFRLLKHLSNKLSHTSKKENVTKVNDAESSHIYIKARVNKSFHSFG